MLRTSSCVALGRYMEATDRPSMARLSPVSLRCFSCASSQPYICCGGL